MRVLDLFYLVLQCLAVLQLWNHSLKGLNCCPTANVLWFSGKYWHSRFPTKWRCGGFHRLSCTSFCVKPYLWRDTCIQSQAGRQNSLVLISSSCSASPGKPESEDFPGSDERVFRKLFKAQSDGRGGDSNLLQLESCVRVLITAGPRDEPPSPLQMLWPEYAFTKAFGICVDCHWSLCTA